MKPPLFLPAPFFILRTPLLTMREYEHLLAQDDWVKTLRELYESDGLLREAIFIASHSLYTTLKERNSSLSSIDESLFNYVIRMATRPTPFGLFSAVSLGVWKERTTILFNYKKVRKHARPDMQWLFTFIQQLYSRPELLSSLPIYTNPLLSLYAGRYSLSYLYDLGKPEKKSVVALSIIANQLTENICSLAREPITIANILEQLQLLIPHLQIQKTEVVIKTLLERQIILPALLPSLLSDSPFEDFLSSLPDLPEFQKLYEKLQEYNQMPIGEGEAILQSLHHEMKALADSKTVLQVDAIHEEKETSLSSLINEELAASLSLLWKIGAPPDFPNRLSSYHTKFIEKYGTYRLIPLKDLLSQEKGLGPFEAMNATSPTVSKFSEKWMQWLFEQWQMCLKEQKTEIIITEKQVDQFYELVKESAPDPNNALLSMDVFCKVLAESQEEIDKGNFLLHILEQTGQAGMATGRFLHLFGEEITHQFRDLLRQEEGLEPDVIFVELSYWPSIARHANVAIQPSLRTYRLDLGGKRTSLNSFSLDQILVAATPERFYFTSLEGRNEIVFCLGNMLNLTHAPAPIQFCYEASLTRRRLLYPFSFGSFAKNAVFLPRVRFQKTILSPAKWHLSAGTIKQKKREDTILKFISWADQWHLPKRFLLVHHDRYLLLDRTHSAHLSEIALRINKGDALEFVEDSPQEWMDSRRSEIVVPFLKNATYVDKSSSFSYPPYQEISIEERWRLPGSDWIFIKYYITERIDYFIVMCLEPVLKHLKNQSVIDSWFFVRYADPKEHIRLRMRLVSLELLPQALFVMEREANSWMKIYLIQTMELSSYEREIERYGGVELIEFTETMFYADALSVIPFLRADLKKQLTCHKSVLYAVHVIWFLKDLGLSLIEMISFLTDPTKDILLLKAFRDHKHSILTLLQRKDSLEKQLWDELAVFRAQVHQQFLEHAKEISSSRRLSIYNSMLHMHCNRIGCDPKAEKGARLYARQTLVHLQYTGKCEI